MSLHDYCQNSAAKTLCRYNFRAEVYRLLVNMLYGCTVQTLCMTALQALACLDL